MVAGQPCRAVDASGPSFISSTQGAKYMRTIEREKSDSSDPFGDVLTDRMSMETEGELPVVLVVDDEAQILKAVRRLLANIDCDIRTAANGADAIDVLDSEDIAVLISDQRMPGLSGVALLNYAMKHYPDTVRIMLTGNGDWETAMEAINLGQVFRFVAKPWEHDQFVRIIEDAIDQFDLVRSKKRYEKFIQQQNEELQELNEELEERVRERTREVTERNEEVNRLNAELEQSFDTTIKAMLSIMEIGDIQIVAHCRRTAELVRKFGDYLELSVQQLRHLERAALLHWIGLINAPSEMFKKSVQDYDAEEMATWEFHPMLGQQAIAHVPVLERAAEYILNYLRRYDDHSFRGSQGTSAELVKGCQLLHVCSAFERTRRLEEDVEGLDHGPAVECGLARLQAGRGTEFAPGLVDSFGRMVGEETGSRKAERRVQLAELEEGMVLSRPIETHQGVPVAPRDVVVTAELLERLSRFDESKGLGSIFIRN